MFEMVVLYVIIWQQDAAWNGGTMPVLKRSLASPPRSKVPSGGARSQRVPHKEQGREQFLLTPASTTTTEASCDRHPRIPAGMDEEEHGKRLPMTGSAHSMASCNGTECKSLSSKNTTRKNAAEVWESCIAPLLEELDSRSSDTERLCAVCDDLFVVLERERMLGKSGGLAGVKQRGVLLRVVFRMLGYKEPKLLTKLARIILAVST